MFCRCFQCHWSLLIQELQHFMDGCSGWSWILHLLWKHISLYVAILLCHVLKGQQFATIHFYSQFYSFFGNHMWIITSHIDINSVLSGLRQWPLFVELLEAAWTVLTPVCNVECRLWFSMPHLYYWTIPWYDLSPTHTIQEHFCVVHQGKYKQHYYIVDWPIACMFDSHRKKGE